jgi:phosphate/sulfate permease
MAIAGLADHVRSSMTPDSSRTETTSLVFLSIYQDLAVLIGTLLFVLVPLIGALMALFLLLMVYRIQQRRKRKHKGLRILRG